MGPVESGGEKQGKSVSYLEHLGTWKEVVKNTGYRGIGKSDSEDRTVRSEGFWRLQVLKEGYFRKSLSFPSQITPSIPENKLQIQHFLLFIPSCEHFVMAADLSFWAWILLKLRKKGANIHKKKKKKNSCQLLSTFSNSHYDPSRSTLASLPLSRQGKETQRGKWS